MAISVSKGFRVDYLFPRNHLATTSGRFTGTDVPPLLRCFIPIYRHRWPSRLAEKIGHFKHPRDSANPSYRAAIHRSRSLVMSRFHHSFYRLPTLQADRSRVARFVSRIIGGKDVGSLGSEANELLSRANQSLDRTGSLPVACLPLISIRGEHSTMITVQPSGSKPNWVAISPSTVLLDARCVLIDEINFGG